MSLQTLATQPDFPFLAPDSAAAPPSSTGDALQAALAREQTLIRTIAEMRDRQDLLAQEANHRLLNGVQSIASLLSAQSRRATPDVAAQLSVAISRIVAFGQVNRRLHLLDHQDRVEFASHLSRLCSDLTALLMWQQCGFTISVDAIPLDIPTATAIPLSYAVNELITNSIKYAAGDITVRLAAQAPGRLSLSVSDQGPGLPAGFDPTASKGLGMRIVQSLVRQIAGELRIGAGDCGRGARFEVVFPDPAPPARSEYCQVPDGVTVAPDIHTF